MPPPTPPPPWQLVAPLGRGGQAATWRVRDPDSGREAALKVFRLADAEDWKALELCERECEVLQRLDHPGIPRYLGHQRAPDGGELQLLTELFAGRSLADRLASGGAFGPGELLGVLRQALDVLDYLHRHDPPIVHRDIKPANLLVASDGTLALIDFGSVRSALKPAGGSTVVGTFGYMAPEQLHGQAGPAADVYSLGVTLAVLATGLGPEALPRKKLALELDVVMPPGPLRTVIAAMTRLDPDERLGSVAAVRQALVAASAPAGAQARGRPPSLVVRSPRGVAGFLWTILLFLVWLATTVSGAVIGVVEAVLPRAHARKRRRIEEKHFHRPRRVSAKLANLDARHTATMRALRATRTNLRAIADRSEPYRAPSDPPAAPDAPRGRPRRERGRGRR
jgi:serine/threonine protein kinase